MLVIKNLSLYLKKDLRTILVDFNFSLQKDMRVALIGEEGNGKSVLLKAIADPQSITDFVEIKGEIIKSKEIIGYLPQEVSPSVLKQTTEGY
ncbi:MAG: ATP-binding cassette domain-containing protein, partial [Firmicutes bacterium]|nr:ATP-binding cassette domain-containing protein [Bacillota bacterium]